MAPLPLWSSVDSRVDRAVAQVRPIERSERNRPGRKDKADAMKYYKPDLARLRPGVRMGGGRIKERKMEVSVGRAKFLRAMKTKMGS
jgi:hypothetical protein